MITLTTPEMDRPDHLHTEDSGSAEPVKERQMADEGLLQKLREGGWELSGDSATNPKTGTKISLGDLLTPTQAREANATLGQAPGATAPEGGEHEGGPKHSGGDSAPASAAPAGEPAPGGTPTERYSKGDVVDRNFLNEARRAGWDVSGDVATSPDGQQFELGEAMSYEQAREANTRGLRKTDGEGSALAPAGSEPKRALVIPIVSGDAPSPFPG